MIIIKDDGYAIIGKYQKSRTLRHNLRRRYEIPGQGLEQGLIGDPCRLEKPFDIPHFVQKLENLLYALASKGPPLTADLHF